MNLEITQNIADMCLECGICNEACDFLPEYCENPKELAEEFLAGKYVAQQDIPYLCNMCSKCATLCPEELDIGKMMHEVRIKIMEEDLPLPGNIKYVKNSQKFVTGDDLFLSKPAPSGNTKRLFFPGCGLTGYSPDMTMAAWKWLNDNDPDCGLLYTCCGAPSLITGDTEFFAVISDKIKGVINEYGAEQLVVICPDCMEHFRDDSNIPFTSLYELMDAIGNTPEGKSGTWMMHDPCKSRSFPELRSAARAVLSRAGYTITEPENTGDDTCCCGQGGNVAYTDAKWAAKLSARRASEFEGSDFVTTCGACRQSLAAHTPGVHFLDLLFNEDLESAKTVEPAGMADTKANQKKVRELFEQA